MKLWNLEQDNKGSNVLDQVNGTEVSDPKTLTVYNALEIKKEFRDISLHLCFCK